jgi:hypothetical protein
VVCGVGGDASIGLRAEDPPDGDDICGMGAEGRVDGTTSINPLWARPHPESARIKPICNRFLISLPFSRFSAVLPLSFFGRSGQATVPDVSAGEFFLP